jgi:BlaI family penicillinase repressor
MKAPKKVPYRLGNQQLRIMKLIWARNEVTVADVQMAIGERPPLAYTTIATMLRKLEERGLLSHRQDGRTYIYKATAPENVVTRSIARDLVHRLFNGSLTGLVSHLLEAGDVDPGEVERLEKLLAEIRKEKR